ncbi:MAG: acetyl-CoA C-acyltransferase, partial [Gammaproteobacteria bacterium]|nr:acetyl-CoA C-acyltransferase [Gammaproteobacteria bacterium]MCZ6911344.1 acetyl-CoA C-acyltransferase [Pseudomonadota bacterium]
MNSNEVRRVAVIGGSRIPFARAYTSYREQTTQDLMIASLKGLVEKYRLHGATLGDVSLGAVTKHSSDWNLARE